MDNVKRYGFRWARGYNRNAHPDVFEMPVTSGTNFTVSGFGTNLNLNVGDPVRLDVSGGVVLAGGNENAATSTAPWGVVMGMGGQGYFNGARMTRSPVLPSGISYGTSLDRQSKVLVTPFSEGIWEIDVNDIVTATTLLAYQALVGENCDHQLAAAVASAPAFSANPVLAIATHAAATATLSMRIFGVSQTFDNQDYAGQWVKMLVTVNKGAEAFYTNVGT
jgi:hypothetical protein